MLLRAVISGPSNYTPCTKRYGLFVTAVRFTKNLQRHVLCPPSDVVHHDGISVAEVLALYFEANPGVRPYVLDDQGGVRRHVTVFVGDHTISDRIRLSDIVGPGEEVFVMQALSGG
jgi:sulfur-carrier protein